MLSIAPTVFAETQTITYDSTVNESAQQTQQVGVEVERAEIYAVTLPKNVVLEVDKDTGTASFDYTVDVTGEISTNHYVRVIPYDNASILDESEILNYKLKVEQERRRWAYNELDGSVQATGTYTPVDSNNEIVAIEPGKYTGVVTYLLACDDTGLWSAATCTTPATCSGYDVNDNGVLDTEDINNNGTLDDGEDLDSDGVIDTEYLETPITRGSALGHQFEEGCTDFPATCARCNKLVYAISTPEQLTAFRADVNAGNAYSGATVVLNNDIDMTGITWDNGIRGFTGTFDGLNHKISNLTITKTSTETYATAVGLGLFYNSAGITIQNLVLQNPCFSSTTSITASNVYPHMALVAGDIGTGTLTNVHVRNGSLIVTEANNRDTYVAGLAVFRYTGTVTNCSTIGTTIVVNVGSSSKVYIAGVAVGREGTTAKNCVNASSLIINKGSLAQKHPIVAGKPTVDTVTNCVWDTTLATSAGTTGMVETNCLSGDTATVQTQDALAILNTDNDKVWILDLEGVCEGYPMIKQ